jgi:hypothetical protein
MKTRSPEMLKPMLVAASAGLLLAANATAPAMAQSKTKVSGEKRAASAGLAAARERQKKCGVEWKEAKGAGKIEKGMKWPQYWSACNKRLKAAGT